jgi:IS5 family transposase
MRPKQQQPSRHGDLFRARLDQIINMKHELVVLADKIDWTWLDAELAECFSDKGRPAEPVRFMLGMFMLKHTYGLSDEQLWERWVHDPYFQYFTGEEFFQHELRHERSGMSHWRKRIGERLDSLLAETLRVAHDSGALKKSDLARVSIDTTVQPKNIAFPTDAKLLETAIRQLGTLAKAHGVALRQSYVRVAKKAAMMAGRYAHAKQFKRMNKRVRFLRSRLGRLTRDIAGKIEDDQDLREVFAIPLTKARQIRGQQQRQRGWKLYSWHAPEVECIGKGKAAKPYEFGVKVSLTTTNRRCKGGQFILHAKALPGNPYDGHTLRQAIEETQALTGREIERIYVDKGYQGHDAPKPLRVFKSGQKRGVHGQIKKELRRRSAIEAVNLRLILKWLGKLLCKIIAAILAPIDPRSGLKAAS